MVKRVTEEPSDSETVAQKKQNEKLYQRTLKKHSAKLKERLDSKQFLKAVKALKQFHAEAVKRDKSLLKSEDDYVYLTFTLAKVPQKTSPKPHKIELKSPLFSAEKQGSRVCVFVKDPARDFKDAIQDLDIPAIAKVIGFTKLRKEFREYKDRQKLLGEYDLFLADLRIYKMLPQCLGKQFYQSKKYPMPLKLHGFEGEELQEQLNSAVATAQFMAGNGPNYSLKVGRTSMEAKDIVKNAVAALPQSLTYVTMHDGIAFSKLQFAGLKVAQSPELPVFNQLQKSEVQAYLNSQKQGAT